MLCLASIPTSLALAQWRVSGDAELCVSGTGNRSLDIAVCGRALGRDDLDDLDRASIYTARGKAYRESGKSAAALSDFDTALALNPYSADTFNERAVTLDGSGDYRRALEDFEHALALSPRFAAPYKNRGLAHFYAGNLPCARADFDAAVALAGEDAETHAFQGLLNYMAGRYRTAAEDFERVYALALPYPYLPFLRYLSGTRSGNADARVLLEARAVLLPGEWPRPLLDAYLEVLDPGTLTATLESDERSPSRQRRIAASHYYLAELERLEGRNGQAKTHFTRAVASSEDRMPERVLAEHALKAADGVHATQSAVGVSECRR